jgi:predicted ester cyclase
LAESENTAIVLRYWERCWNHHDVEALHETHHETFAQNGVGMDIARFQESLRGFFGSFPDVRVTVEDVMAKGDRVLMRVRYHATQAGPYEGLQPRGGRFDVSGLELFLVLDGRVMHHWHEMDHLAILRQLEAIGAAVEGREGRECVTRPSLGGSP